jgi:signal-transduction protein with cAMP-binding, CBS, and nucleotidyltransferase domain
LEDNILLLEQSPLFGEAVSFPILAEIIKKMEFLHYQAGRPIPFNDRRSVLIISKGAVKAEIRGYKHRLEQWDFFGAEREVSNAAYNGTYIATEDTVCLGISLDDLREIPVAYWTYIETIRRRRQASDEGLVEIPV